MEIFLDTEFTGLHQNTTLVSIGCVSEDDRYFYAEFNDYDSSQLDDWLRENLISNLRFSPPSEGEDEYYAVSRSPNNIIGQDIYYGFSLEMRGNKKEITSELSRWLKQFSNVEIWSDCLAYDWVLFNDLFGGAQGLPENIFYIPFDICTAFKMIGVNPYINRENFCKFPSGPKHNALHDAKVIKSCYKKIQQTYCAMLRYEK